MRWFSIPCFIVLLAAGSAVKADIMSWTCQNDGDGAINSQANGWWDNTATGDYALSIAGSQFWGPAHMTSTFQTDTTADPTIIYRNYVTNDTGLPWFGYQVGVEVRTPLASPLTSYSISSPGFIPPGLGGLTPPGWAASIAQPLTYQGNGSGQNVYAGLIYYSYNGGTPVVNGADLDFSYVVSFQGSKQYMEVQTQTPVLAAIPEPRTLALLAGGLFLLFGIPVRLRG